MREATAASSLTQLDEATRRCRACPRLVAWREQVAAHKRKAFLDDEYWGRPVPGFGPSDASVLVVGLAPAAHGANRTGRMFTGDRSGDGLYASLHRVGLASQPTSTDAADGLCLLDTRVTAAVHCAPPNNKPTPVERDTCAPWLRRELQLLKPTLAVIVALGSFAWTSALSAVDAVGGQVPKPRPSFGHGVEVSLGPVSLLGSYHPSQQNTFTGRLTQEMLDDVLRRASLKRRKQ
ncbi:MAG: uracil-DNA glycosylase [Actinomycetes bacterium]